MAVCARFVLKVADENFARKLMALAICSEMPGVIGGIAVGSAGTGWASAASGFSWAGIAAGACVTCRIFAGTTAGALAGGGCCALILLRNHPSAAVALIDRAGLRSKCFGSQGRRLLVVASTKASSALSLVKYTPPPCSHNTANAMLLNCRMVFNTARTGREIAPTCRREFGGVVLGGCAGGAGALVLVCGAGVFRWTRRGTGALALVWRFLTRPATTRFCAPRPPPPLPLPRPVPRPRPLVLAGRGCSARKAKPERVREVVGVGVGCRVVCGGEETNVAAG